MSDLNQVIDYSLGVIERNMLLWQNYSTRNSDMPAILKEGSRSVPHGFMDHALIYGDYYFFEALTKLARPDIATRAFPRPEVLAHV